MSPAGCGGAGCPFRSGGGQTVGVCRCFDARAFQDPARRRETAEAVRALVAERDALRAMAEGRTVAPTKAEMLVHWNAGGWWLVLDDCGHLHSLCVRERGDVFVGARRIMAADSAGRFCAWPSTAEVSRG